MVDLPVSESQARMEEEFGHTHRNIFEMFAVRLRTQALQLWAYLRSCLSGASHSLTAAVFPKSSDPQSANRRVVNDDEVTLGAADPSSELPTSYPPRLRMPTISNPNEQPKQQGAVDNDDDPIRSGGGYRQPSTSMYEFLTRDNFNLHKMIVVATGCGKVFGIESEKGRLVWEHLVRDAQPSANNRPMLFQQRNTAHFPLPPITTYFSRSKHTGLPVLYSFNPITGAVLQKMSKNLFHMKSDILQTILLPGSVSEATEYVRPLMMLDTHLKVHIYPERYTSALKLIRIPLYVYTIEPSLARLIGYKIRSLKNSSLEDEHTAVRVWQMYLHGNGDNANVSTPHSVVAAASRAANEHIHSVGRVLGDRSVLYKYLNPNLLAVITAGGDVAAQTNSVMLYLIDVVLGRVLHSAVHRRCSEPVNLIHSENWIVYGYYNHKSLRHEITVLELFESTKVSANGPQLCASHSIPSPPQLFLRNILPTSWFLSLTSLGPKQGNANLLGQDPSPLGLSDGSDYIFSSLLRSTDVDGTCSGTGASPIVPQILQQSYILTTPPGHGVAAVSLTERGITSKSIILGLQKGALIEIPKSFLDPRRALDLSPELVEEGVHPYAPVLPLSDQAVISYNQSVLGIRAIRTAATGLESTSVVFAHGLDLFFTRIAPSLTYDLLKEDFDYTAIATVTLGMIIASFVTQRLAARRVMLRAWA
ncbi:unnamed protein product [Dicrocoelium dendriticum]|nr:unnamed protein product [Dicrocoelium dendriticum]